jgi:hypothetical protein
MPLDTFRKLARHQWMEQKTKNIFAIDRNFPVLTKGGSWPKQAAAPFRDRAHAARVSRSAARRPPQPRVLQPQSDRISAELRKRFSLGAAENGKNAPITPCAKEGLLQLPYENNCPPRRGDFAHCSFHIPHFKFPPQAG